jgi:hypothetical protein
MRTMKWFLVPGLALGLCSCASMQGGGSSASSSQTASTTEAAPPPPAAPTPGGRIVKSKDGTVEGEIVGTPAAKSKFAKLEIGMSQRQVEDLIGAPNDSDSHITGKSFIPFYFGGDTYRMEAYYKGEGQLTYSPQHMGGTATILIRIAVDPHATGYRPAE